MPYLVTTAFEEFFTTINLPGDFRTTANTRREWVIGRLRPKFTIVDSFATGSIPRFTAVTGHADVDVFVVLHYGQHIEGRKPSNVLRSVREALGTTATSVRRNGQAVTLRFQSWPAVDVVPAAVTYSNPQTKAIDHYEIPDMHAESWLTTRPRLHSKQINGAASARGPSFRKLIKMIKWWNHRNGAPLQSFHIEVIALRANTESTNDLTWLVNQWFNKARDTIGSRLWHEDEYIDSYLTWEARVKLQKLLSDTASQASTAWYATYGSNNDHARAIRAWRGIFGQSFPAYG